jgi:Double sensory domain of two-component sensor kinase
MFLSKIWFILVAVAAGVALSIALTAPRPMAQKLEELEGQRLDRAQYAAEQMLKVDAHKWIDRVAKLGRDAILSEALDSASHGSGEIGVQHKTVQSRIRSLLPDLATAGIATIIALDGNGRVVARIGDDENEYGENMGGAEVIADALRGYLSDDVWGARGKLLRVAGAPVLSKNRDRIVGALVVGAESGSQFAERLKKNLDVDVALLLHGKVVASTIDPMLLSLLPSLVDDHKAEIDDVKRTPAIPIEAGSDILLAVAAPFPGQASQQQGYYTLVGKKPVKASLSALLANTSAGDLKWGKFPWISLVGAILAAVVIGLLLQRLEVEGPIARMRAELRTLARGEAIKLDDHKYSGGIGGIARDVNAAIEHYTMSSSHAGGLAGHETKTVPADAPAPGSTFAAQPLFVSPAPGGFAGPPSPGFAPPPAPGFAPPSSPGFAPPPPPGFAPPSSPGSVAPAVFAPPSFPPSSRTLPQPAPPLDLQKAIFGDTSPDAPDEEDNHVQEVYLEFLATKQQCGESSSGLTLDKFRTRLQENKAALMTKHVCRTVRFSVHVKDGKASLRATPIK